MRRACQTWGVDLAANRVNLGIDEVHPDKSLCAFGLRRRVDLVNLAAGPE